MADKLLGNMTWIKATLEPPGSGGIIYMNVAHITMMRRINTADGEATRVWYSDGDGGFVEVKETPAQLCYQIGDDKWKP